MNYRLSAAADDDLLTILIEGVERFGTHHAQAYRNSLERTFVLLGDNPRIARLRMEVVPPVRAFPHPPFLIIYDIEEDGTVLIQRIRHGRSDWINDPL